MQLEQALIPPKKTPKQTNKKQIDIQHISKAPWICQRRGSDHFKFSCKTPPPKKKLFHPFGDLVAPPPPPQPPFKGDGAMSYCDTLVAPQGHFSMMIYDQEKFEL